MPTRRHKFYTGARGCLAMFPAGFFLGSLTVTISCMFYFRPRIKDDRMAMAMRRHRQADVVRPQVVSCLVGRGAVSAPPPYRLGWNCLLSDQGALARTWHRDRLYRRGVPSIHIAKSDECLMMRQYRTWTLLGLLVLAPAKGQTPDTMPRVRVLFGYGAKTCKKRAVTPPHASRSMS
jgi:hypothetical protein